MTKSSARFEVSLTDGAERDLESIYDYISEFDSVPKGENRSKFNTAVEVEGIAFPHLRRKADADMGHLVCLRANR